ncbi:hypothetical protein DH2020_025908 [Rehmannia glutinosa]|uniref:Pectate lyase domain-containing protein n=1 Tax=Rehmannia glutinosa TaxID=99300 RepID=A0ABR0W2Q7_REHGL
MGLQLPYCHVDSSLRALAGQAEGFGRLAIGGLNGAVYCVTTLAGGRGHDVDAIQIKPNSKHIWVDRCSLSDYGDGLIDITRESTDITISRCHFANHDKTILIGADSSNTGDRCIRVYSQCNIYEAGHKKVAFKYYTEKVQYGLAADKTEECTGCIKSDGDLFIGKTEPGLVPLPSESCVFHPSEYYETWTVEAPTDDLKHFLQHCTGWQSVDRPADIPTC